MMVKTTSRRLAGAVFCLAMSLLLFTPLQALAQGDDQEATQAEANGESNPISEIEPDSEYLFGSHELTELTLELPFKRLFKKGAVDVSAQGTLVLSNPGGVQTRVPVTINTGSGMRSEYCSVPPLAIRLPREQSETARFKNLKTLYLTTHCRNGKNFEQYLHMEYMMYRMYGLLSEHSLGVRRARIWYVSPGKRSKAIESYAYVIEDLDAAVQRLGLEVVKVPSQQLTDMNPHKLSLFSLFQFLVGNTDWSAFENKPGKNCCHNAFLVGKGGTATDRIIVPYDFDQAGLINTSYATSNAKLPIRSVKQRLYRGNCGLNSHLPEAMEALNAARPQFEALFSTDPLLTDKFKKKALKYLAGSYEILNSRDEFEKQIVAKCR